MYFLERKKAPTPLKDFEKKDEENWPLKSVIFVEDVKTVPMGKVVKVRSASVSLLKGEILQVGGMVKFCKFSQIKLHVFINCI